LSEETIPSQSNTRRKRPFTFYTGFGKIQHEHYPLTESMFQNGRALIVAKHIQDIREVKKPGCLSEILAYSIPQVKIRQPPYNIFIQLDDDRKIIKLECQCQQGDPGMSSFKKSLTESLTKSLMKSSLISCDQIVDVFNQLKGKS
jgi:hypothetical protein